MTNLRGTAKRSSRWCVSQTPYFRRPGLKNSACALKGNACHTISPRCTASLNRCCASGLGHWRPMPVGQSRKYETSQDWVRTPTILSTNLSVSLFSQLPKNHDNNCPCGKEVYKMIKSLGYWAMNVPKLTIRWTGCTSGKFQGCNLI